MARRARAPACCLTLASLAALLSLAPATAVAARKPITGRLAKGGYSVMAVAYNGRVVVSKPGRRFRIVPPGSRVTLHLRDKAGHYAGPLVVGGTRRKAILGVRAGVNLGSIVISKGYGRLRDRLRNAALDARRYANARARVPIGAGRLGLVVNKPGAASGRGQDADRDGLPGVFDIDDDGDRFLDNVDVASGVRAAVHDPADPFHAFWVINGGLEVSYIADDRGTTQGAAGYALNQNAAGPFAASGEFEKLRDLFMKDRGALYFPLPPGDLRELDCGGLSYCSRGGTGGSHTRTRKFPEQFDPDGDGFGTMEPVTGFAEGQDGLGTLQTVDPMSVFGLAPNAGASQIAARNTLDTYVEHITTNGTETLQPVSLGGVFGTVPALAGWSDGTRSEQIAYPVPRGGQGSEGNPIEIKPAANGDYLLSLTVWRPQRRAISTAGEGDGWIDIGGLRYRVVGKTAEQNRKVWNCPDSAYSTSDANLSAGLGGIRDAASDRPVAPANTLTFTVNLSECFRFSGHGDMRPGTPPSDVFVTALSAFGDAAEGVGFAFKPVSPSTTTNAFSGTWRFVNGSPGTEIEWTAQAHGDTADQIGPTVFGSYEITGGTPPPGWTCSVDRLQRDNDLYHCTGNTLAPGQSATGRIVLNQPGTNNMSINLFACASGSCTGYGMRQTP